MEVRNLMRFGALHAHGTMVSGGPGTALTDIGEGEDANLSTVLVWLRRYSHWLEDRVRLNAGVRAFLWVVKAPRNLLDDLRKQYQQPPAPGSVAGDGCCRGMRPGEECGGHVHTTSKEPVLVNLERSQ
jgi:hypothetical protein